MSNVSADLIWEISRKLIRPYSERFRTVSHHQLLTGSTNSYLVKTRTGQFSRDPLNLTNLHSRKVRLDRNIWKEYSADADDSTPVSSMTRYK
jgi:hypothetical protein